MIILNLANKKVIWLMAIFMIVTLTACGSDKKSAEIVLLAKDADLSQTRGVILEPKEPPFNLGGWRGMQIVQWQNVEIPVSGEYTVGVDYSREHTDNDIWGTICIYPHGAPSEEKLLDLHVQTTSDKVGDWSVYKYQDTLSVLLEKGSYIVEMYPGTKEHPLPVGEYFLNLRSIKFILKEAKEVGDKKESGAQKTGNGKDDINAKKNNNDKKDNDTKKDDGDKDDSDLALPAGKWFKNGIKSAGNDYAETDDTGTISLFDGNGKKWHTDKTQVTLNDGQVYRELRAEYISVKMDSRNTALPIDALASPDLDAIVVTTREPVGGMDIVRTKTVYLHESVINTPQAHNILQKAKLFGYVWKTKNQAIDFYSDGVVFVRGKEFGKWTYEDGVLSVIWEGEFKNDGMDFSPWDSTIEEECKVDNVEDGFTLPRIGRVTGSNTERV